MNAPPELARTLEGVVAHLELCLATLDECGLRSPAAAHLDAAIIQLHRDLQTFAVPLRSAR